jgi:uncharacterized protein YoxC
MIEAMTWAGAWLMQRSASLADTIYTKQIQAAPSTFERVASVASGLLTIAFLVFVVAAVPAMWNFRKSYHKVSDLLDRIYGDVNPIMRHASTVADNVDYITTAIRTDMQRIQATIATANLRLQEAVSLTERRLHDMSALLEVVQQEAEQAFVSTASAVRGVRTGATALSRRAGDDGTNFANDLEDDLDRLLTDDEAETEEEQSDGYDHNAAPAADDTARPRVRSRRQRRREGTGRGGSESEGKPRRL